MKAAICKRIKTSIPYVKVVFVIIIYFAFLETCLTMGVYA
jgi:hypothetical protein